MAAYPGCDEDEKKKVRKKINRSFVEYLLLMKQFAY